MHGHELLGYRSSIELLCCLLWTKYVDSVPDALRQLIAARQLPQVCQLLAVCGICSRLPDVGIFKSLSWLWGLVLQNSIANCPCHVVDFRQSMTAPHLVREDVFVEKGSFAGGLRPDQVQVRIWTTLCMCNHIIRAGPVCNRRGVVCLGQTVSHHSFANHWTDCLSAATRCWQPNRTRPYKSAS